MKVKCEHCQGDGWTIEPAHNPYCDGSCVNCPVAEQVRCEYCWGMGYLEIFSEDEKNG